MVICLVMYQLSDFGYLVQILQFATIWFASKMQFQASESWNARKRNSVLIQLECSFVLFLHNNFSLSSGCRIISKCCDRNKASGRYFQRRNSTYQCNVLAACDFQYSTFSFLNFEFALSYLHFYFNNLVLYWGCVLLS